MNVRDTLDRPLRDLRISVTDRCNFRCVYCMPKEVFGRDYAFLDRRELLTFEEIERLARAFVAHGVEKIRITGGEPLVRRDLERLIEQLAAIDDLDLTLTTNGSLLPQKAALLRDAGLRRVTVSLDSLDDETFQAMNDVDFPVDARARGHRRGGGRRAAGQGQHGRQARPERARDPADGARVPRPRPHPPLHRVHGRRPHERLADGRRRPRRGDRRRRSAPSSRSSRSSRTTRGEVARRWRYEDGSGEIGVIASVTQPFCGDCTRARLSAEGRLYTCLFALKRPRSARARPRRRDRRRAPRGDRARLGTPNGPVLRASHRQRQPTCPRSR